MMPHDASYLHRDLVLFHKVLHPALPCFNSGREQTNQTVEMSFYVFMLDTADLAALLEREAYLFIFSINTK